MSAISHEDVGQDLRRIAISGRLDTMGTGMIASQLTELAATPRKSVVIDLTAVQFLASAGVGMLIGCAKAVKQRGGKLVLVVDEASSVMMSLEATGIDQLIPVYRTSSEAEKAALA
jgi:anti-sigma B factor antagonist